VDWPNNPGQRPHGLHEFVETVGNVFKGGGPIHSDPFSVLLEHGLHQTVFAVERFVTEAIAVCDPAFVDLFVF